VLSDILASQVAAGEVVERPASVVKELVENSIDAGAKEVRVDVDKGGAALIRVSDDGCGMSRDDALLSLERHATSKLRVADDLAAIRTLGFRGEAVPSIASVSRFKMVTREHDAVAGTEIVVDGGTVRDVKEAGCAPGTVIEAKSLFFNMPARKKFMRAESTEAAHIEHQLRLHALAAPWVRFRFRKNDREVFDLPPVKKSLDRVRQLLGTEASRELIEMPKTDGKGCSVEGFLLPAGHARKGRRHQCVFLNGRPVEDAVISRALTEGFRGAVADGMHPAAWLWIQLDPSLVDVNVHPAKREVRFHRPNDLKAVILEAVAEGLRPPKPMADEVESEEPAGDSSITPKALVPAPRPLASSIQSPQANLDDWQAKSVELGDLAPHQASGVDSKHASKAPRFRVLGLLQNRYVVMESDDGLVLFDPKAAKERIYYEALLGGEGELVASQGLLVPVLLELDPRDVDLLLRERDALQSSGIEVDSFGGNTIQVRSLPECLDIEDAQPFLGGLLDELLHDSASGARFAHDRLAKLLAKRAAFGVQARISEAQSLLDELFTCDLPYCTAEGRPTLIEMGMRELDRRFGIKGS